MFYLPFWVLILTFAIMAIFTIILRGFNFVDFQVLVMIVAISFLFDMVFCKWLLYYSYVVTSPLKAFYSLIFCIIGYPSIGITFLKFLPSSRLKIILYIVIWSIGLTLAEIFIAKPYGIVLYNKWSIILYSPIIYVISFAWELGYYKLLKKHFSKLKCCNSSYYNM